MRRSGRGRTRAVQGNLVGGRRRRWKVKGKGNGDKVVKEAGQEREREELRKENKERERNQ